jgi:hypothetical protein
MHTGRRLELELGDDARHRRSSRRGDLAAERPAAAGEGSGMRTGQKVVLGAWLSMIVLATVRHVSDPATTGTLPPPSGYLSSGVLFTMFYGGSGFAPGLFGALAVGAVVAAIVKPYLDAKGNAIPQSGPIFQLSRLIDSISGTQAPAPSSTKTTGG